MQIIQWIFKIAHDHPGESNSSHSSKKQVFHHAKQVESRDIVVFNDRGARRRRHTKRVEQSKLNCNNLNLFYIFPRKDIAKTCFCHSLNLKRLRSFRRRQQHSGHPMKMTKEDIARGRGISHKTDSSVHVGNKVLPITDSSKVSSINNKDEGPRVEKKEKPKGEKIKTVSRMKELLKWAAASKSGKGGKYLGRKVLQFRNQAALKAVPNNDQLSNESPKISFGWDLESCSTTSSAYSTISMACCLRHYHSMNVVSVTSTPLNIQDQFVNRTGNWITTDSEFVVLEL